MAKLQDKETASAILTQGQAEDFWALIQEGLDITIAKFNEDLESDDLDHLEGERYKYESKMIRTKIKYLKMLKTYPETLIANLKDPSTEQPDYDPYDKPQP